MSPKKKKLCSPDLGQGNISELLLHEQKMFSKPKKQSTMVMVIIGPIGVAYTDIKRTKVYFLSFLGCPWIPKAMLYHQFSTFHIRNNQKPIMWGRGMLTTGVLSDLQDVRGTSMVERPNKEVHHQPIQEAPQGAPEYV